MECSAGHTRNFKLKGKLPGLKGSLQNSFIQSIKIFFRPQSIFMHFEHIGD